MQTKEKNLKLNKDNQKPAIPCGSIYIHTHAILKRENFDAIFASIYNVILKTKLCGLFIQFT